MASTKADIVERLFDNIGLNKHEAKELVDLFFNEIKQTLEVSEQVGLSGFGKFELKDKIARPGRNPKTGEEVTIEPRRVVTFKPSSNLKTRVGAYTDDKP
jgi:integration host factor subunit alpha